LRHVAVSDSSFAWLSSTERFVVLSDARFCRFQSIVV